MGKETNFMDVMEGGDVLMIMHPTTYAAPSFLAVLALVVPRHRVHCFRHSSFWALALHGIVF